MSTTAQKFGAFTGSVIIRFIHLLRALLTDFWMLPLAFILYREHEKIIANLQLFPSLTPEKVGKIVPAFILFLLVMSIVRLYTWAQYHDVYSAGLMTKRNKKWQELTPWQRFFCLRLERWVLLLVFAIILSAM